MDEFNTTLDHNANTSYLGIKRVHAHLKLAYEAGGVDPRQHELVLVARIDVVVLQLDVRAVAGRPIPVDGDGRIFIILEKRQR